MRTLVLAMVLLSQAARLCAAEASSAQFLNLGFGARALGMGEAFTAVADDISAVHYNPAGLAGQGERREALLSHALHLQDTSISQLAYAARGWGYSAYYFNSGKLEGRSDSGAVTGDFTATDFALAVSRGVKRGGFELGATGRVISQRIKTYEAFSMAADLGALYRFRGTPYSAGAALTNFGTRVKFRDESYPLPLRLRVGGAARFEEKSTLVAADAEFPNDGPALLRLGAEYTGARPLALRLGWRTATGRQRDAVLGSDFGDSTSGVAGLYGLFAGFGFKYAEFSLDYALLPYGDLGSAHRFSLGLRF
jgi:hypothetical protein